ncbi:MAG: hypothetical protein ACFFG0_06170 [Candidatus Thorarchaeota archaeon]
MFEYKGEITPKVKKLLNNNIIMLGWNEPNITNVIINKICPNCNNKLLYADRWYDKERIVIFKRLCPTCRRIFVLSGYFKRYYKVKDYFINKFRMNVFNKKMNS